MYSKVKKQNKTVEHWQPFNGFEEKADFFKATCSLYILYIYD